MKPGPPRTRKSLVGVSVWSRADTVIVGPIRLAISKRTHASYVLPPPSLKSGAAVPSALAAVAIFFFIAAVMALVLTGIGGAPALAKRGLNFRPDVQKGVQRLFPPSIQ